MIHIYKKETWKNGNKLVKRDEKGKFISVLTETQKDHYANSMITAYYENGKLIFFDTGLMKRKEPERKKPIYRTSYVLNQCNLSQRGIPVKREYYGFRIVCFSDDKELLHSIKYLMKQKLIKWIKKCVGYSELWFDYDDYLGYESPTISNAYPTDNNTYDLLMENERGTIIKELTGRLETL